MAIRFSCPNGHRIQCSDNQAGRVAKCPQCGARIEVPTASEASSTKTAGSATESTKAAGKSGQTARPVEGSKSGLSAKAASSSKSSLAQKEPEFEFLCPNGHHLHGPTSLQGHAGQCPDCGARFRIPSYDDVSESNPSADQAETTSGEEMDFSGAAPEPAAGAFPFSYDDFSDGAGEEPADSPLDQELAPPEPEPESFEQPYTEPFEQPAPPPPPAPQAGAAWAELVARLWAGRVAGSVVEICTTDGETILPERFAEQASQGEYGVFAVKASNGTFTVTAVNWQSVSRVVVRGLKALPDGMFD